MAEAIELNLPLGEGGAESVGRIIKPLLDIEKENKGTENSKPYNIENYYVDDILGSDVLKQKYLAPGEKHPHELWKRQAKALASVENNKSSREQWEEKFGDPGKKIKHALNHLEIRWGEERRKIHDTGRPDAPSSSGAFPET